MQAYQLFKARAYGADAVLLIAAVLPNNDLEYLIAAGRKLGLQSLVEVSVYYLLFAPASSCLTDASIVKYMLMHCHIMQGQELCLMHCALRWLYTNHVQQQCTQCAIPKASQNH